MLGLMALLAALLMAYVVYLQTSVLLEARRHAHELQANRVLADKAEASRFTELHAFLETELKNQTDLHAESRSVVMARVDQLDRNLRALMEQTENTLLAHIGELDDRVERWGHGQGLRTPA
jgi:hypothetical protein